MGAARPIRQIPRVSIAQTIAETIEGEIICGKRPPGERLVERQIATHFRVSTIPVREALQILETRGLVIKRINRGCSVIWLTPEEMAQMSELRDWLEPKVIEWAACRRTEEGLRLLSGRLRRLREAAESGSYARFFGDDLEFHRCMWDLAGNPPAARALITVVGCLFACGLRNSALDLRQQYLKHERLYQSIAESRPADAGLLLADISAGFRSQLYRVAKEQE